MYSKRIEDYKPILEQCFSSDKDLLEKWHIEAPASIETCVNRTFEDLQNVKAKIFVVKDQMESLVGYYGKETLGDNQFLTGFFIIPEFRNRKIVPQFWDLIKNEMNRKPFYCGLYDKNLPAINFIKNNRGVRTIEVPNGAFYLVTE